MITKINIFIVIPAYNEEKRIGHVLKELRPIGLPIIVVDDGSTDTTKLVLGGASNTLNNRLTILRHRVNLGKGAAMKTGAEAAFMQGADAVIFMDSDGQHKPQDLPKFIEALNSQKYDVVFGSRNLSFGVPLVRFLGNKFASVLVALLFGKYVSDLLCGYRALTRRAYRIINWESAGYAVETEMAIKTAKYRLKHCEVPVQTVYLDNVKGVTIIDSFNILIDVLRWRLAK